MDIKELIPKHKSDFETAEKLLGYSYEDVKQIVPDLLAWIQDINWPVSRPVADYLISISEHLTDDILEILRGDDPTWKHWTILVFGFWSEKPLDSKLLPEIRRIALSPTKGELLEEVDEIAREALDHS